MPEHQRTVLFSESLDQAVVRKAQIAVQLVFGVVFEQFEALLEVGAFVEESGKGELGVEVGRRAA